MIEKGADISADGLYRYSLWRTWDKVRPAVMFIGLNPSTADATDNDATIRRCIDFANRWGYGSLFMLNLFAYRSKKPYHLRSAGYPVGPENDEYLQRYAKLADKVVYCWGGNKTNGRDVEVLKLVPGGYCITIIDGNKPGHPLFLKKDLLLKPFEK